MNTMKTAYLGAQIFDGVKLHENCALIVTGGRFESIVAAFDVPPNANVAQVDGILSPGFVDIQVNGGGGVMFTDDPSVDTLQIMASAHARLGATSILPTLITDTPEQTRAAITAVEKAIASGLPGIIGLHLEGPHLAMSRKGAHDPALIRRMDDDDVAMLVRAAQKLPVLMVTLAPENVSLEQIRVLAKAGIILSLGHSDAGFEDSCAAVDAGASCVTHLFNAMSQLSSREPGLVGAALRLGQVSAGIIADFIHVHPDTMAMALAAKTGPGRIFLVSDAMATAGSDIDFFTLNDRRINRRDGRLTLEDGTLAGADLDLAKAVKNTYLLNHDISSALAMATLIPAKVVGAANKTGAIKPGHTADFVRLNNDIKLVDVWRNGRAIDLN